MPPGSTALTTTPFPSAGAVYVFVRSGDSWAQQAYIKASNPGLNDGFGTALALVGDTLAVGAPREASAAVGIGGDESNNQASGAGAVYVFVRQGTTWTQQAYIKASNTGTNDNFGAAVALTGEGNWFSSESSGDLLAVGALGRGAAPPESTATRPITALPPPEPSTFSAGKARPGHRTRTSKPATRSSPTGSGRVSPYPGILSRWARRLRPVERAESTPIQRTILPSTPVLRMSFAAQAASGRRMPTSRRATPRLATDSVPRSRCLVTFWPWERPSRGAPLAASMPIRLTTALRRPAQCTCSGAIARRGNKRRI